MTLLAVWKTAAGVHLQQRMFVGQSQDQTQGLTLMLTSHTA